MKAKKNELEDELIDDILSEDEEPDETIRIPEPQVVKHPTQSQQGSNVLDLEKSGVSSVDKYALRSSGGGRSPAGVALVHSENLRVAQHKILSLEEELERLRSENEALAAAGQALKERNDELISENEYFQKKQSEYKENFEEELEILNQTLSAKDRETKELKLKLDEYEKRLSTNLQKIRVRERELENRLELVKMESSAVVRSKDELLLDYKRKIDQAAVELENYRNKSQGLNKKIEDKNEMLRRTVKALRLALSMLESDDSESA